MAQGQATLKGEGRLTKELLKKKMRQAKPLVRFTRSTKEQREERWKRMRAGVR